MNSPRRQLVASRRDGFTLLEVILALVVLGAAVAILGEVMRLANRGAVDARAETQAQLLAASVMDEMIAGYADLSSITRQPLVAETDGPWVYSVTVGTSTLLNIVPVEVVVEQDLEREFNPVRFRLTRWLADLPEAAESSSAGGSSSGSSTAGSQTGGTL